MDLRKIDALIAEHVMGWAVGRDDSGKYWVNIVGRNSTSAWVWEPLPKYSSDISAAWEVVERLDLFYTINPYEVEFRGEKRWGYTLQEDESLPLAICLAALKLKDINYEL